MTGLRKGWKCFGLWKATFVLFCLSLLIKVDVNAVSQCINRVELLERLLIPSGLGGNINASSFILPYSPSEAGTSGIGWCPDDLACNNGESHFIEFDFGAEVIIEAVAVLRAGGSYVTHYNIEYAGSDRDYHCIGEGVSNEPVFNGNSTCNLNIEPSHLDNPVIARFVRVNPLQWVGASVCLRMQLYGCTIKECRTAGARLPLATDIRVLNFSNPLCITPVPLPHSISVPITFDRSVYLTQLLVTGNSVVVSILLDRTSGMIYQNILGITNYTLFYNTDVIPLWPAINTTHFEFLLFVDIIIPICFAVELTGCLSRDVVNHIEDTTTPPTSTDVGACRRQPILPIPTRSLASQALTTTLAITSNSTSTGVCQSTVSVVTVSVVTVTTTMQVIVTPMVQQQSEVSSDNNDDCNTIAIVVPTALVFVTLIVIICINVMIVGRFLWKRRKSDDITTSIGNHTTFVVENDLYQSQDNNMIDKTANIGQYSLAGPPDSTTLSSGDKALDSNVVANNEEPVHYDYATEPPVDHSCYTPAAEYDVVMDIKDKSAERYVYSVPKAPPLIVNPSYTTNDTVVHNVDEQ